MSKYPPRLKQQAMGMYAVGEALTDIADRLGIHRRTVGSWYESKIPADWEAERQKLSAMTASRVAAKLAKEKLEMATRHLDDLETLRKMWRRPLFVTKDGQKVSNEAITAAEIAHLARAYQAIQGCERLILGEDLYKQTIKLEGDRVASEVPQTLVDAFENALAKAAAAPAGEGTIDEDDD